MTKDELIEIFSELSIPFNEGVSSEKNKNVYPRITFWDYIWQDESASGEAYDTIETYQISFYSKTPRNIKLLELRELLRKRKLYPQISHEYVETDKIFHSYFSLDVRVL